MFGSYGGVFGVGGSNGAISGFAKSKMATRPSSFQDGGSLAILENSNGDISAADHPIYYVFGSRVGFSRSADRMVLFGVGPHAISMWEKTMRDE